MVACFSGGTIQLSKGHCISHSQMAMVWSCNETLRAACSRPPNAHTGNVDGRRRRCGRSNPANTCGDSAQGALPCNSSCRPLQWTVETLARPPCRATRAPLPPPVPPCPLDLGAARQSVLPCNPCLCAAYLASRTSPSLRDRPQAAGRPSSSSATSSIKPGEGLGLSRAPQGGGPSPLRAHDALHPRLALVPAGPPAQVRGVISPRCRVPTAVGRGGAGGAGGPSSAPAVGARATAARSGAPRSARATHRCFS